MIVQRKSRYMGEKLSLFILLFFILVQPGFVGAGNNIFPQENTPYTDSIKSYPGIPIISYLYRLVNRYDSQDFEDIVAAGAHSMQIADLNDSQYSSNNLGVHNFMIIPDQNDAALLGLEHILIVYYTGGRYSVWQPEGTPDSDGLAKIKRNETYTVKAESDTVIRTRADIIIPNGTELINGPSYQQEGVYGDGSVISYTANYYMKLENIIPQTPENNDTICILAVTATVWKCVNGQWNTTDYHVIDADTVLYNRFTPNQWKHFTVNYDLTGLPDDFYEAQGKYPEASSPKWTDTYRVENVEFKVIWKGNSEQVKLYVDNITLYDDRGLLLQESSTQDQILSMTQHPYLFQNKSSGWHAVDEPGSIDNFEPIRIVNNILESVQGGAKLWVAFGSSWNGRYKEYDHPTANSVRIQDEFMRRVKKANVWQNHYLFNSPMPLQSKITK